MNSQFRISWTLSTNEGKYFLKTGSEIIPLILYLMIAALNMAIENNIFKWSFPFLLPNFLVNYYTSE